MATPEQLEILHSVAPAAQAAQTRWGVPASVTLAQWIFESSWGTSKLAQTAHNYFGVKAREAAIPGTYCEFPTAEYENGQRVVVDALFEKYPDEAASFDAHARLLATSGRYQVAMSVRMQPERFAVFLQRCGYSTNPSYAQELIGAMREYDLYRYDTPPDGPAAVHEVAA
jgi:flagellum-specific peptidoglycan hydrolase FlgJ